MPSHPLSIRPTCWLFCTVIDNFGDIGVSWRLAKMLAAEHRMQVYLWLDNEAALRALCPDLPPLPCTYQSIRLNLWQENRSINGLESAAAPDLVIETFGCRLPEAVEQQARRPQTLWLNWEYLSAESWAEAMHGKASLQADGSRKYFWLMGFSEKSGGLLREQDYRAPDAAELCAWRAALPVPPADGSPEWLLFGYLSPIWAEWLACWQSLNLSATLLLAGSQIIDSLKTAGAIADDALSEPGSSLTLGRLRLIRLPFVPQSEFDRLLHHSDLLMVRGEDSFVRAQLSGKPFLWHIYPQDEAAHIDKLHAFWRQAAEHYAEPLKTAHQTLSDELNSRLRLSRKERLAAWRTLLAHLPAWQSGAQQWSQHQHSLPSALEKLAKFREHG